MDKELIASDPKHYLSNDFGYDVIPSILRRSRNIYAYNFNDNIILSADKNEKAYWRYIGELDDFTIYDYLKL